MSTMQPPKSPLVWGLLGVGALYLMARRSAASRAVIQSSVNTRGQQYATPTGVAQALANFVVGITKNVQAAPAQGADATPTTVSSAPAPGFSSWLDSITNPSPGGDVFSSPLAGWSAPVDSFVKAPGSTSWFTDQTIASPVYDIGTDFTNNPFALAAP